MGGLLYEAEKGTKKSFAVRKCSENFGLHGFFLKKKPKIGHFAYRLVTFLVFCRLRVIYLNF